jgi:hypothetical protein
MSKVYLTTGKRAWKEGKKGDKKSACVREITQAKEVVPGTASIYGLCFSAMRIIPIMTATVCDPILRFLSSEKITPVNYLACGLRVVCPVKLRISRAYSSITSWGTGIQTV